MAAKEFVVVRFPKEVFEKAKTAGRDLGDTGAAFVIVRSVTEMLEMADAEYGTRRVPKIVRTLDAARSEGELLPESDVRRGSAETPTRSRGGHKKYVVKGGRG
jgi:hypothetical protein